MKQQYGVDSMPETGENVAEEFQVKRADQDAFALRSQQRAGKAIAAGYFAEEIVPVEVPGGKAGPIRSTRTSIRAPTPRSTASPSSSRFAHSRHRDGRQRIRRQRRRRGHDPRLARRP